MYSFIPIFRVILTEQWIGRGTDVHGRAGRGRWLDLAVLKVHSPDQLGQVVVGGARGTSAVAGVGEGRTPAAAAAAHNDRLDNIWNHFGKIVFVRGHL